ncbi:hypothetical protein TNCV_3603431 [Trichonephila clavipes]|nr:hypothetical protein TNCV_3603431 [Trichonephila clavipes]
MIRYLDHLATAAIFAEKGDRVIIFCRSNRKATGNGTRDFDPRQVTPELILSRNSELCYGHDNQVVLV